MVLPREAMTGVGPQLMRNMSPGAMGGVGPQLMRNMSPGMHGAMGGVGPQLAAKPPPQTMGVGPQLTARMPPSMTGILPQLMAKMKPGPWTGAFFPGRFPPQPMAPQPPGQVVQSLPGDNMLALPPNPFAEADAAAASDYSRLKRLAAGAKGSPVSGPVSGNHVPRR